MSTHDRSTRTPARRFGLTLVAGALVLACVPSPAVAGHAPGRAAVTLQRDVNALLATGATGVLAEVSAGPRPVTARAGVADPATRRPIAWDAKHRIESTTKSFVATVVLQLAGEGTVGLDDPVDRWLPGLVGTEVTVRQLLGHTSGLPDYADDVPLGQATTAEEFDRERFRTYSPGQLVAMAMRHPPVFAPGQGWSYSNTNYVLAGMIIEKVTGAPWEQAVHERIIEPLGLTGTVIPGTSVYLPSPRLAAYQRLRPGDRPVDVSTRVSGHADASIISTPGDVNRFLRALLGGKLLPPLQLTEMQTTVRAEPFEAVWDEPGYGLGLMKRRLPCGGWVWFHGGGWWNAITDNAVTPDGRRAVTVAIASSLDPGQDPTAQAKASAALIDHALCGER
ncbi:D-alanyl-D-alanine carboxypeptidase [Actinoplanes lutulentus]|uniref:D-alanyl-D-alanine carboxypeptidase n=1 Tax=Actinoplanes lutulentus TaxID=1287878 RepID=A0A327Z4T2_9ACTN|nr:serine hydrolase domain-containing protein [Actinoplanes lutulentus]MBB2948850.1 D-alanyl-D-alanine carboxypeptidase [Actinoplanes lutulentus]RAK29760.1 D-alanyl-D-alanine carboxypeptidase [Actinoplanes lutulentus]